MESFELSPDIYDPSELRNDGHRGPLQPVDPEKLDLADIDDVKVPLQPSIFDEETPRKPQTSPLEEKRTRKPRTTRRTSRSVNKTDATGAPSMTVDAQTAQAAARPLRASSAASSPAESASHTFEPLWPTVRQFFSDGRFSLFIGVVLILTAAYLLIASISYIANTATDQSLLVNNTADILRSRAASLNNSTGWVGALLSHFIVYRWLGVGGFIMIFYVGALGLTLVKLCHFKFWELTFKSLVSAIALSLIVGLATYSSATPTFWGGEHGYYINSLLIDNASLWSALAVSVIMLTALILIFLRPVAATCKTIGNGFGKIRGSMERRHNDAIEAAHRTAVREQAERREAQRRAAAKQDERERAAKAEEELRQKQRERGIITDDIPVINEQIEPAATSAVIPEAAASVPEPDTVVPVVSANYSDTPASISIADDEKSTQAPHIELTDIEEIPHAVPDTEEPASHVQATDTEVSPAPDYATSAYADNQQESPAPSNQTDRLPIVTLGLSTGFTSDSVDSISLDTPPAATEKEDNEAQPADVPFTMTTGNTDEESAEKSDLLSVPATKESMPVAIPADSDSPSRNFYDPRADLSRYKFPTLDLLREIPTEENVIDEEEQEANKERITNILRSYGVEIASIAATIGPTITLYEIVPAPGVRIAKIKRLGDDVALNLSAMGIRIIAPIPGKGTIGMEVPNKKPRVVSMRSILSSKAYCESKAQLPMALGRTIQNEIYVADLAKMPHLLVAGATGMGKSVGLNTIIASLLYRKHPAELKFVLVDPKMVEFSLYKCIERHYLAKLPDDEEKAIITDPLKVVATLNSLCIEMDNRYQLLSEAGMRGIKEYNEKFVSRRLNPEKGHRFLPYIVVVIDEFADLILTAGKEVETPISRIAAKARAVGIHMILATQRPSVNVITGVIKANFPGRMAFRVTQRNDSQTILDRPGAEQLIGRGDMLISRDGIIDRVQCAFIDTPEVEAICEHISRQQAYPFAYQLPDVATGSDGSGASSGALSDRDSLFAEAGREVIGQGVGSTSSLQRKLNIGYPRAGKIMDQLEMAGVVGPNQGGKPRAVLMDMYSFERFLESSESIH